MDTTDHDVQVIESVGTRNAGSRSELNEIAHLGEASEDDVMPVEASSAGNDEEQGAEKIYIVRTVRDGSQVLRKRTPARLENDRSLAGPITAALVAAALALGSALLHKAFKRRGKGKNKRRLPNLRAFIEPLDIRPPEGAGTSLERATVAASDLLQIWGRGTRTSGAGDAKETAQALRLLQEGGATIKGRTRTEELHFGLLGEEGAAHNLALPERIASGTACGVALAVAAETATIGIGIDHLAGIRVQAACNGLWGYRASTSAGLKEGAGSVSGPLDALGWMTKDPSLLLRVGRALQLPGVVSKGDLLQVIVAEDLFKAVVRDPQHLLLRASYKAARAWAGQEEVARGLIMNFLFDACPAAHYFIQDDSDKADVHNIMEGLRAAAAAVQAGDFRIAYSHLLEQPQLTSPEILEQLKRAQEVSEEAVAQGRRVMEQAADQLKDILRDGNLLMLPVLPCAPPDRTAAPEELASFERGALQLSSIAALAGLPQVCIPVTVPGQPPASVALVGLQRSDMRLLAAAEKLGPLVTEAAVKLAAAQQASDPAVATNGTSTASAPSPKRQAANGTAKKAAAGSKAARNAAAAAEAETHKAAGNELFKAGSFEEAVKEYSRAIELNPDSPVYYSNRAMAYLQIMQFAEAEADCDKALKREISVKTLLRRGTARRGKHDLEGARADFKHVLSLEPKNRQARTDLLALKEEEKALQAEAEKLQAQAYDAAAAGTTDEDVFL